MWTAQKTLQVIKLIRLPSREEDVREKGWGRLLRPKPREEELSPSATEQMESVEAEIGSFLVVHHHSGNLDTDKHCNNVPKIQEDKTPAGDGTRQRWDPHLGYRVRTVWKKWICFWLRRKYTSKTFTNLKSESNQPSAGGALWQSLSCRHLLLLFRSRHRHIAARDQLNMCRSAVDSPRPGCESASVANGCFLDDGELVASQHKVYGNSCPDARPSFFEELFSHGGGRDEERGFSDMFQQIGTQMRLHCWEQLQEDTEELLAEEGGGESVYESYD